MRDTTPCPEGITTGTLKQVGTDEKTSYKAFRQLLEDSDEYARMSEASDPNGDGLASKRIVDILENS